jgi:tetratricopeptide (TPR) repeat protein
MLRREISDLNGTIEDLNLAINKEPDNAKYFCERAESYVEIGKLEQAFDDLTRSIALKPSGRAYKGRGKLNQIKGKDYDAIDDFSKALESHSKSAELFFLRGNSYNQIGQYKKAVADYTDAISLNGCNADFYKMRATAYEKLGELDKASTDRGILIDDFQISR